MILIKEIKQDKIHLVLPIAQSYYKDLTKEQLIEETKLGSLLYAFFDGDDPVGFMQIKLMDHGDCMIQRINVLEGSRGQGFGRTLIDYAVFKAQDALSKYLEVEVTQSNQYARDWFLTYGFTLFKEQTDGIQVMVFDVENKKHGCCSNCK